MADQSKLLTEYVLAGARRIRERDAWLDKLAASPESGGAADVRNLVRRVRVLELAISEIVGNCSCSAQYAAFKNQDARRVA